jgi:hypothetical protein
LPYVPLQGGEALRDTPREQVRSLLAFLVLSYAVTWAAFITVARWIPAQTAAGYALILLGAYTPGIVALLLTARTDGSRGVRALLRRILIANVPLRIYVLALTYIVFSLNASLMSWLGLGLLWVAAAYFLATMPRALTLDELRSDF